MFQIIAQQLTPVLALLLLLATPAPSSMWALRSTSTPAREHGYNQSTGSLTPTVTLEDGTHNHHNAHVRVCVIISCFTLIVTAGHPMVHRLLDSQNAFWLHTLYKWNDCGISLNVLFEYISE